MASAVVTPLKRGKDRAETGTCACDVVHGPMLLHLSAMPQNRSSRNNRTTIWSPRFFDDFDCRLPQDTISRQTVAALSVKF